MSAFTVLSFPTIPEVLPHENHPHAESILDDLKKNNEIGYNKLQSILTNHALDMIDYDLNSKSIKIDNEGEDHYQIKIFPWCPLSKNTEIPISADWVVTLVDPVDKVKQMYETEVLKDATSKGSSTNEQSDSSESD